MIWQNRPFKKSLLVNGLCLSFIFKIVFIDSSQHFNFLKLYRHPKKTILQINFGHKLFCKGNF